MSDLKLFVFLFVVTLGLGCSDNDPVSEEDGKGEIVIPGEDPDNDGEVMLPTEEADIKWNIIKATASEESAAEAEKIKSAYDGKTSTFYHSVYKASQNELTFPNTPVVLEFTLTVDADRLDYLMLYPRADGGNGAIMQGKVYVKRRGTADYPETPDYTMDYYGSNIHRIQFAQQIQNPESIKLVVTKGGNELVSLAEIEAYKSVASSNECLKYFTDLSCSAVKPEYSRQDLAAIDNGFFRQFALSLYDKEYDLTHRLVECKTFPAPEIRADENRTGTYSIYDNATGIYVDWGDDMVVFVDRIVSDLSLCIVDPQKTYTAQQTVNLKPGLNRFRTTSKGLIYLVYQSEQQHTAKVNLTTGKVNGVFDLSKNRPEEWTDILANAGFTHLDMIGEYTHLIFSVAELRQYTPDGKALLDIYDEIVRLEDEICGVEKYPTRMCCIASEEVAANAGAHATTYRVATHIKNMEKWANVARLKTADIWGPCHEIGHIHQTFPGFRWGQYGVQGDLTEVSNNVYALYVQTEMGIRSRLLEEDAYNSAWNLFFIDKQAYNVGQQYDDVFERLVPMWQLQLYFAKIDGKTNFYSDLHRSIRQTDYSSVKANDERQVRFCMDKFAYLVSRTAGKNMVKFFNDYGFRLSEETVAEIEALNLPEVLPEIRYVTDENIELYRSGQRVVPGTAVVSKEGSDVSIKINEDSRNAVAYEVYESEESTVPVYISAAKRFNFSGFGGNRIVIKAVGANGERKIVE